MFTFLFGPIFCTRAVHIAILITTLVNPGSISRCVSTLPMIIAIFEITFVSAIIISYFTMTIHDLVIRNSTIKIVTITIFQ